MARVRTEVLAILQEKANILIIGKGKYPEAQENF